MSVFTKIGSWFKKSFVGLGVGTEAAMSNQAYVGGGSGYHGYSTLADGSKYILGISNSGISPLLDNYRLRQNAREAYHDSTAARGVVDRYADTVVDVGLRLDCSPMADILGITPEEAEEWSRRVEKSFHLWALSKKAVRDETMNFYQAQRLAEISQQRDGEYFVRLFYTKNNGRPNPLQVGFLDPNQIRGDALTSTTGFQDRRAWDGIERDMAGREIAYLIWVQAQDGSYKEVRVPALGPRSKRRMMLHGFAPEYAGQGRGYSRLSHVLQEFSDLTTFTISQIKKAIQQSALTMWVKPDKDNPASDPFEGITHSLGAGPATDIPSTTVPDPDGLQVEDGVTFHDLPEAAITQPGQVAVFNLNKGEEIQPFKSTAPSESYDKFVEAFLTHLSASTGMPSEVLLMKFGENYSASRGTLILFWRIAQIWRHELATDFLSPVYEEWLTGEIAAGRVSAPGWSDPVLRQAWLNHKWFGAPMPNIDPLRTAKADETYVGLGAQTLDHVARNHNGSDGSSNRAKLTRELGELPSVPWRKELSDGSAAGGEDAKGETEKETSRGRGRPPGS